MELLSCCMDKDITARVKSFAVEDKRRTHLETWPTLLALLINGYCLVRSAPLLLSLFLSLLQALLIVRIFVIYHDSQHGAIFRKSFFPKKVMKLVGLILLAPEGIWKRSHNYHHASNGKVPVSGAGSYPVVSSEQYLRMNFLSRLVYKANRHYLTIFLGYFTVFIFWLNVKSCVQSPRKHIDSYLSLLFHFGFSWLIFKCFGLQVYLLLCFFPFLLAFGIGSYLFYCQHNFPGVVFYSGKNWSYAKSAIHSTSYLQTNRLMRWFTANIGYHTVHHINAKVPFYTLPKVMDEIQGLKNDYPISLGLKDIVSCLKLKLWDEKRQSMITWKEFDAIYGERTTVTLDDNAASKL
jgi:omega-6 fatty acid desaturase (delta-12 desaturase)